MEHFDIQNLTFSHAAAKGTLDGVSLRIRAGEFLVLCGRSGSGKTTLLRHLKTVLTPNGKRSGEILFCGTPLAQVSGRDQAAKIGFVMQNPDDQIVTDKVWHELAFGLESLGCDHAHARGGNGLLLRHSGLVPPRRRHAFRRAEAAFESCFHHGDAAGGADPRRADEPA